MRNWLLPLLLACCWTGFAPAQGMLIPTDRNVSALSMVKHQVQVDIEEQVAVTKVVQVFRNHTSRALEATYIFPVPKGASVQKFSMWVDGKEVTGELVEADKARQIYTDIVRRTQDPGLLEYIDNRLLRVRVFPVPANGKQKLSVRFTSIADNDSGTVEYLYPLKSGDSESYEQSRFSIDVTLKSRHPIHNIYSPSHTVEIEQTQDHKARVRFQQKDGDSDKDFQLYYTTDAKDVGLTTLFQRPDEEEDGHFLLLLSPRAELSKTQRVPRDVVFVLDTSGSMQGVRIRQAKNALMHCLRNLHQEDRFGLVQFATVANKYRASLQPAGSKQLGKAREWVDNLTASGSTNIGDALTTALAMRPDDCSRNFTVVFFTDGRPTIGETSAECIIQIVEAKNSANTRIFTFGVGDDVNAVLLDRLAESTRSVCTYVRENEDIEDKVSKLYNKISKPVLTNLTLQVGDDVSVSEIYPPQLPDLFHGSQLVVLGRYRGNGNTVVTLTGMVGKDEKEFEYKVEFPNQTKENKTFVEELWARRKVGYLLSQIRANGQNKELVDEVVSLAKKYGITTPYTSYLVVPDNVAPVANIPAGGVRGFFDVDGSNFSGVGNRFTGSAGQSPRAQGYSPTPATATTGTVRGITVSGPANPQRIQFAPVHVKPTMRWALPGHSAPPPSGAIAPASAPAQYALPAQTAAGSASPRYDNGNYRIESLHMPLASSGKQAVDLSVQLERLRNQNQVSPNLVRCLVGTTFYKVGLLWVDERIRKDMKEVAIKAQSKAYFELLKRHPQAREVFQLGNQVKWVTPSGVLLVIEVDQGDEELTEREMDVLFTRQH